MDAILLYHQHKIKNNNMGILKRKNSFWQLYGMLIICWGLYLFLILIGSASIAFLPVLVLMLFSLIIIVSHWSSNVEVSFSKDFLMIRHYYKSRSKRYDYSKVKSVEHIFLRVEGRRLIFKCSDSDNKIMEFAIYNPDDELLEFISSRIKTYKNRIT